MTMISLQDKVRWRNLARKATQCAYIEGCDKSEEPPFEAMYFDKDEYAYPCAIFDLKADALLFVSAPSIINRLLDALDAT